MKFKLYIFLPLAMVLVGIGVAGCTFTPVSVTTRHFILTPMVSNEVAPLTADQISAGIGTVRMPAYLLQDSLAVRSGTNEMEYFEGALWAERLDHGFQETLTANLSKLLGSDRIYMTDWAHDQVMVSVFVSLEHFDVDSSGQGTLVAQWRINDPENNRLLKSGQTRLNQAGSSPHGHPEAVAATLSILTEEFSRELAPQIAECSKLKQ